MRGSKSSAGCGPRTRSISRACTTSCRAPRSARSRCSPICRCGSAARPRRRSGAPRGSAPAGRPGGETPEQTSAPSSPRSAQAAIAEGRPIDDDHYGAGIPFRFGRPDDPASNGCSTPTASAPAATRSSISRSATPRRSSTRIAAYVAAGISKFILRPAARGDAEMLAQTRRLIDEVLPLVAARWPKPRKRLAARVSGHDGSEPLAASAPASSTPTARCSMSHRRRARCADALGEAAPRLAALWRDKQLQYSWLRAVQGRHADFWQVTGDALDFALDALGLADPDLRERLMQLYLTLDAYPDAPAVLRQLRAAGLATAILSNGSPAMLARAVDTPGSATCSTTCCRSRRSASTSRTQASTSSPATGSAVAADSDRLHVVERLGRLGCLRLRHARDLVQPPGQLPRAPARRPRPRNPLARRTAGAARALSRFSAAGGTAGRQPRPARAPWRR